MPPDRDLDRELRDLGPRIEYPPTPDLARSVGDRLEAENGAAGSQPRTRPHLWWIAAAALVLLAAVPVFSLALRETGGAFSAGGGAAGVAPESGGQEARDAGSARLTEEAAAGPTHSAGDEGALAAGAGEGAPSSMSADSDASAEADAACGWPETSLEARPQRGAPGDGFGIRGRYFESDVWDCDPDLARVVRITFSQGGREWKLGSFEVSEGSRLTAKLEVPADARPGRATVRATYEQRSRKDTRGETSVEARFFVTG